MTTDDAFSPLRAAFPATADWQGLHFCYAAKNGAVLLESKKTVFLTEERCRSCEQKIGNRDKRFFYWLLIDGRFRLIHASKDSKLARMRTIGSSLTPSVAYEPPL